MPYRPRVRHQPIPAGTKEKKSGMVVSANCAAFADDIMAETELFGYVEGTFTGAQRGGKPGLFQEAHEKILFLDEVHHLSKRVQAKLMKAIETDQDNYLSVLRVGASKPERVRCKLIFVSNQSIAVLREMLLPDFYDRISQLVIELPPLRETPEDQVQDWQSIWEQMRFSESMECPLEAELIEWLQQEQLPGNYRDLQKIAIYYKTYLSFDAATRKLIPAKSALEFAQQEFAKYHSPPPTPTPQFNFERGRTAKEMLADYHKALAEWAIRTYRTNKAAAKHLNVTTRTLYNWQDRKHT